MMIISARWNLASSILKYGSQEENSTGKLGNKGNSASESGFVLHIAPLPLSRDRKIKMKKSINQSMTHDPPNKNNC